MPRRSNEISIKNLRPISTSERARELNLLSQKKKAENKMDAEKFNGELTDAFTTEINIPASLREGLNKFGIKVPKKERMHKVVTYRALLKALKDGNIDPLLKLADFAGFSKAKKNSALEIMGDADLNIQVNFNRTERKDEGC